MRIGTAFKKRPLEGREGNCRQGVDVNSNPITVVAPVQTYVGS